MAKKSTKKLTKKPIKKVVKKARQGKVAKVKPPEKRAKANAKAETGAVRPMTGAQIEEAFRRFKQANPEPKTELQYVNPFTLLVAVVLSAQATDAGVNKATPALFALADTPEKMAALGEDRVRDMIKTIGLFRNKAKNVVALSHMLIAEHGGNGAALARGAGGFARRRPQDRQCRAQCRLWRADYRGRYPYFPRRQPYRHGGRQGPLRGRAETGAGGARRNTKATPTIGLFCTGATLAWRANRYAKSVSLRTCANGRERPCCKTVWQKIV